MAVFIYPQTSELKKIEQVLMPRLAAERPVFEIMPIETTNEYYLAWEQMDNYVGLQQLRGLDGQPNRVTKIGASRFVYEPGVYGEYIHFDERELTTANRTLGTWDGRVDMTDRVVQAQEQLLQRELDRIEYICWILLTTATFSVSTPTGAVVHTDSYTMQTYNATTWGTASTATPVADLRAVQLKSQGYSVDFGSGATVWVNRTVANRLLANTNAADLGGMFSATQAGIRPLIQSLEDVNRFLLAQDLPQVRIYDGGYLNDSGTFTNYIGSNYAVVVGRRPAGQAVGEYRLCANANNPGMAGGSYTKVVDRGETDVPRTLEVHRGHNGGPVLYFPSAVCIMDIS